MISDFHLLELNRVLRSSALAWFESCNSVTVETSAHRSERSNLQIGQQQRG